MRFFPLALCIVFLTMPVLSDDIFPNSDVIITNAHGELITIFSPHSFYFDGRGFEDPVKAVNGTLQIGNMGRS